MRNIFTSYTQINKTDPEVDYYRRKLIGNRMTGDIYLIEGIITKRNTYFREYVKNNWNDVGERNWLKER